MQSGLLLEHTFRFLKQQRGWTRPLLRDPAAADRWTWLLIACYAQLWLARDLAAVTRLPWQPAQPARAMTPGRVRAGFRRARQVAGTPASTAKPCTPGPADDRRGDRAGPGSAREVVR
jgi:hypothetical protein